MSAEMHLTERSRKILGTTARIFAVKGYHGTGMRDIAEALGMKAGSLYFHLASKDAALEAVCVTGLRSALRAAEHAVASGPDLATRVHALIMAEARELREHSDYIAVHLHERRHLSAAGEERLVQISRAYRALLDRIFSEAQARGELAADMPIRWVSLTMVGILGNMTKLYINGPIRDFDDFCENAARVLLTGISAAARP